MGKSLSALDHQKAMLNLSKKFSEGLGGYTLNGTCPRCSKKIVPLPTKKTQCPACRTAVQPVYLSQFGQWVLAPEALASKLEYAENRAHYVYDWLSLIGKDLSDYFRRVRLLRTTFNQEPGVSEVIESLLNDALVEGGDHHALEMAYFHIARFLRDEGKEASEMAEKSVRHGLLYLKDQNIEKIQVVGLNEEPCATCRRYIGKVYHIDEALKRMPVPVPGCSHPVGYCDCSYEIYLPG